jgi:hypothetical protein
VTNPDSPNPVSSETLERLRMAGFSEHEIDDMLARARAATTAPTSPATPQPAAASFSGRQAPMTGAISKVSAVHEHAHESAIAGDKNAPASRRFRAFPALAIVAAVVAVLGFGVSLELSKLQAETALATAQDEVARQTALVAELRQKGEADETAFRAEITQQGLAERQITLPTHAPGRQPRCGSAAVHRRCSGSRSR